MAKISGKDLYFIHIPKNAGTAFIDTYCNKHHGHFPAHVFPPSTQSKCVAIVRNPYDRLVSIYKYNRMRKNYWHSFDGSTKWGPPPLYDFCINHTFEEFVEKLREIFPNIHRLPDWGNHTTPQYTWLINNQGDLVVPHILYFENLQEEIKIKLNLHKKMKVINPSDGKNYEEYYTEKTKNIVYQLYQKDFELFQYPK